MIASLLSSWFGSTVCLSGYFNKACRENPYWKWPVTRTWKTNRAIIQLHQRNTWRQPALSIWKRLMKHYLQVSGLSCSITALNYKRFPNHRGNRYTDTLKDKWECCHMQGQSQSGSLSFPRRREPREPVGRPEQATPGHFSYISEFEF